MAITKEKKEIIITKLKDIVDSSKSIVFVSFDKLTANESNNMRKVFADEDIGFFVVKKTLIKNAFSGSKIKGDMPELEGEVALTFGDDSIKPARAVKEISKKVEGVLEIIGGVFEGEFQGEEKMRDIASIPRPDVLYTQFLMVIKSPVRGFASVLDQVAKKSA